VAKYWKNYLLHFMINFEYQIYCLPAQPEAEAKFWSES